MADTDSTNDRLASEYLAAQLERLMGLPLDKPEDVEAWDKECADVQAELERRLPNFEMEHYANHFLTDSDIRLKDLGYRQAQHQAIFLYFARLRHGGRAKETPHPADSGSRANTL